MYHQKCNDNKNIFFLSKQNPFISNRSITLLKKTWKWQIKWFLLCLSEKKTNEKQSKVLPIRSLKWWEINAFNRWLDTHCQSFDYTWDCVHFSFSKSLIKFLQLTDIIWTYPQLIDLRNLIIKKTPRFLLSFFCKC